MRCQCQWRISTQINRELLYVIFYFFCGLFPCYYAGRFIEWDRFDATNECLNQCIDPFSKSRRGKAVIGTSGISVISSKMLLETKAITVDLVLNKVSGVYMVNLGNEQHSMSIRQPMTTKSLFLYLEDGIPVRTTGLFNHNALLEINMAAVKNIEVIKGPSSSLYGSDATGGVVNFISVAPTAVPVAKLALQGNNIGYKRSDLQIGFTKRKWGVALSRYYADKRNCWEHCYHQTDCKKSATQQTLQSQQLTLRKIKREASIFIF